MDNSQTFDIFLNNSITEDNPLVNIDDTEPYDCKLLKTKKFFSAHPNIGDTFSVNFLSSLNDSFSCISQSLETIVSLLNNCNVELLEIKTYMEDVVNLLQMLSHFIKNVIESLVMTCPVLSSFPTTTGKIILLVFTHCKESESLYGNQLNSVEKQLKDLFRSCHNLQLIYLTILEKHFVFDMSNNEDQNVLLEALNINLKIGETVQALDVKTMAEQWKAYTAICDKYSNKLMDMNIYNKCSKLLCKMIEENIKTALMNEKQEKIVLRSLKVASFTIKILMKVSNMFKDGPNNNYECILEMLIYIFMKDCSLLGGVVNKPIQLTSQMNSLVLNTTQSLLSQLLLDERFFSYLVQSDIRNVKDNNQLGYVLLLIGAIKSVLQISEESTMTLSKPKLVDSVLNTIPYCHVFFNIDLKYQLDGETYDLEQYYLTHVVALCMTLNSDEFAAVERRLLEAVLGINCCRALFCSKLWILVSRVASRQYTLSTIMHLCNNYEKLESDSQFCNSPQEVHLSKTIAGLFENLPNDDKFVLSKQLDIQNESRWNLLRVLKINNLPNNIRLTIEENVLDRLLHYLKKLSTNNMNGGQDMGYLTEIIQISSTSSLTKLNPDLEECIVQAWRKACPRNLFELSRNVDSAVCWYYTYVKALITLTDFAIEHFYCFENIVKVHNVLTNIILTKNVELIMSAIALYCKVSFYLVAEEQNQALHSINETLKYLMFETEDLIKKSVIGELFKYSNEKTFKKIVEKLISESSELQVIWNHMLVRNYDLDEQWKKWMAIADNSFVHKCIESEQDCDPNTRNKKSKSNFELDIDNLFEGESDSDEPASKKAKMDNATEEIIKRLEQDSLLLSQCGVADGYKKRISAVCDRLRNIT